jgi:hypothetical protein
MAGEKKMRQTRWQFTIMICFSFLFLGCFIPLATAAEIELKISRNDRLNPGSKIDLWLHIVSHAEKNIRALTFHNGCATAIYLVDSFGNSVPFPRFSSRNRGGFVSNQRPFCISPGDTSGAIVWLKNFRLSRLGAHFMIFAIPDPQRNSVILSSPCKLSITNDHCAEAVETISFDDLPAPTKKTFRMEFEKLLTDERIPLSSCKLPF